MLHTARREGHTGRLVGMNSNAFQCLVTDDELRASLRAIRTALREGGRFAFGTRHVPARAGVLESVERLRHDAARRQGVFLAEAGLRVEHQYGDWLRGPVTPASQDLVTVARGI
jgi:hypothetical protein